MKPAVTDQTIHSPASGIAVPPETVPPDLGHRAARGMAWFMGQTVGVKLISMIANIVLAWFLLPGEAGLVGMAFTVLSIAGVVQYIGMQDVLVQRQAEFQRWTNPAFWMLLAVGLAGGLMVALAAPLGAALFDQPRLAGMILLLAIASPLQTTSVVPQAMLSAQLRFRAAAIINTCAAIANSGLSIILAQQGFGAYSFVIPVPVLAAAQLAALWIAARPSIQWSPQFHLWRLLARDTAYNWGVSICVIIITTADHVALSLWHSSAVVGLYFWAVTMSTQLLRLIATNLSNVLLPSLSKLHHDPPRQFNAFVQSMRILAMIGIPACLLQAAVARPLVRILYPNQWDAVGPVLAALSVGMALYFATGPAATIMKAQARFKALFALHAVNAMVMIAAVVGAALLTDESNAALVMAIVAASCLGVFGPIFLYVTLRSGGSGWRAVGRIYAVPLAAGLLATGLPALAMRTVPDFVGRDYIELAGTIIVCAVLYPLLLRWMDPEGWRMAWNRLKSFQRAEALLPSPSTSSSEPS